MSSVLRSIVLFVAISGTACDTSDKGVTVHNTDPVVRFEAPVEGSTFQVSEAIEFVASVQDNESAPTELELEWTSDLDGLLEGGTTPSADGSATFVTAGLSEGLHTVTLKATDPRGLIGSDYMTVKVETDCLALTACDYDEDGYTEEQGDCDDNDDTRHPDAEEIENGIDDDCDDLVDEGTQRYDDDGDGYTELEGDCDDDDDGISPMADELLDGVDQDCDDLIDEGTEAYDDDGDCFCEGTAEVTTCTGSTSESCDVDDLLVGDCNDDNSAVHPGAEEVANGVDDDCDGVIDEGSTAFDDDGDGYTELGGDCDDSDPLVSPVGIEVCGDEVDNDCDSYVDDEDDDTDEDGDGFSSCEGPEQDCDDDDEDIHPEADEVCGDEVDNDCDGDVDADDSETDADADGYSTCSGDCDDTRSDVNPGMPEMCDLTATDDDCDGEAAVPPTWYYDGDGDGYGYEPTAEVACSAPSASYITISGDCEDTRSDAYPGATEVCDDIDNDCDDDIDESGAVGETMWYPDVDGDLYGDEDHPGEMACSAPPSASYSYIGNNLDCDDETWAINPAAEERCDGVDWDCSAEEFYPAGYAFREEYAIGADGCMEYHRDEDGDTYGAIDDYLCLCDVSGEYRIPAGEVTMETDDCCDTEWGARPGSGTWSNMRTDCGSWDWNCDDDVDARWTENGFCGLLPTCDTVGYNWGWRMGGYMPSCGEWGTYLTDCDRDGFGCEENTESRQQECR